MTTTLQNSFLPNRWNFNFAIGKITPGTTMCRLTKTRTNSNKKTCHQRTRISRLCGALEIWFLFRSRNTLFIWNIILEPNCRVQIISSSWTCSFESSFTWSCRKSINWKITQRTSSHKIKTGRDSKWIVRLEIHTRFKYGKETYGQVPVVISGWFEKAFLCSI